MTLELFEYTCAACGTRLEVPVFSCHFAYGQFVLRSPSGHLAYLDAFECAAFDEVSRLVAAVPEMARHSRDRRADVFQAVFGPVACDPAPDGTTFAIGASPRCPSCGGQAMAHFRSTDRFVEVDVPPVTCVRWSELAAEERSERVRAAVLELE